MNILGKIFLKVPNYCSLSTHAYRPLTQFFYNQSPLSPPLFFRSVTFFHSKTRCITNHFYSNTSFRNFIQPSDNFKLTARTLSQNVKKNNFCEDIDHIQNFFQKHEKLFLRDISHDLKIKAIEAAKNLIIQAQSLGIPHTHTDRSYRILIMLREDEIDAVAQRAEAALIAIKNLS